MELSLGHLTHQRDLLLSAKQRLSVKMAFAWDAYSKPCPSNAGEMLTLIFLCVFISLMISSLLFLWMVFSLDYDSSEATIVTCVCECVILVMLILVHPVRCVITVAVPSLATKQGRKILLSTALLYAISICVPNMIYNITISFHMLKCGAGNVTQSVLQSRTELDKSLDDIMKFIEQLPSFEKTSYRFKMENVNLKGMEENLSALSESMTAELASLNSMIGQISKVLKKLLAALFMVLIISSSVAYVKGYLMHINYDNVYQSQQLMEALRRINSNDTLPDNYQKKLVKTSGVRMRIQELQHGIWGLLGLLFYAAMCGMMLCLDYFVYWTQQFLLSWTSDIPEIHAFIKIDMTEKAKFFGILEKDLHTMSKRYPYTVPILPPGCLYLMSVPERSTLSYICLFMAIGFLMLLGEVFARRLRRKVCASFYRSREEQRTQFLVNKIIEKRSSGE